MQESEKLNGRENALILQLNNPQQVSERDKWGNGGRIDYPPAFKRTSESSRVEECIYGEKPPVGLTTEKYDSFQRRILSS